MGLLILLFLGLCGLPQEIRGHIKGPHHPRGDPIPASEHPTHSHYTPRSSGQGGSHTPVTHDLNLLHDKEHIKEDVGKWVEGADGKSEMSPEEMEFYYFKMHDFDKNNLLDGLEILQAITHVVQPHGENEGVDIIGNGSNSQPHQSDTDKGDDLEYYAELIDRVLQQDDVNGDGYLSYFEYVVGRRREQELEQTHLLKQSKP